MKTIKIFLGSSLDELYNERRLLGDYIMNSVRPIFKLDGVDIEVVKCEDIRTGYRGKSSQEEIDNLIRGCDISVFMFKTKAGPQTVREYNVAQELVGTKNHEIYVYCFGVTEEEKEESLKSFKQQMRDIELYWKTCKDINDLEKQLIIGLLDFERQLLGLTRPSAVEQESKTEKDDDSLFADFMQDEKRHYHLREKILQDIENLLQQIETMMVNEDETIAARIFKVIGLYKKADQWAAAIDYDKEKYSNLLFDYARFLNKYGLYKDAESVYIRQIPLVEELYGIEHEKAASSYNEIGVVYWHLGEYEKALKYHFKALAIREKEFGTEHPFTATSYNNIGVVYRRMGKYEKALEYYFKALAIREKALGTEHPETATSYNNIGTVYAFQGDYGKALEYYYKTLAISEKVLGTEHPNTATTYNNIGLVYRERGDYDRALEYHFKALTISEKVLGKEHPDTATTYNNIGLVYRGRGDYDKALEYFYIALSTREKVLGKEHPDTVQSYNDIGLLYKETGDFDKSVEYYNKALAVSKRQPNEVAVELGGGTIDLSSTYDNTEKAYSSQPSHPEIDQPQDNKGVDRTTSYNLDTATSYNNIGEVLKEKGDYDKALKTFLNALSILEKLRGEEDANMANSYNGMGHVYYHQGDYAKAQEFLGKAYRIREKLFGVNDPDTEETSLLLEIVNVLMAYV